MGLTVAETRFKAWALRNGFSYVKKLPDFKQTGSRNSWGLPDFLCVSPDFGNLSLWEVKAVPSRTLFPLIALSPTQWEEFGRLLTAGHDVRIWVRGGGKAPFTTQWFHFSVLVEWYGKHGLDAPPSVSFKDLYAVDAV